MKKLYWLLLRHYYAAHAPINLADAMQACGYRPDQYLGEDDTRRVVIAVLCMMRHEYAAQMLAKS